MEFRELYPLALLLVSLVAFVLYAVDKARARRGVWRIRESLLLGIGFFGGAAGALIAMRAVRHKTKHWYFWAVNILGLLWQLILLGFLFMQK